MAARIGTSMSATTITRPATAATPSAKSSTATVPRSYFKRHPVLAYYMLAFAISWGGILLVIIGGRSAISATQEQFDRLMPFAIPFMLFGPGIAGIVMTGLVDGMAGYRELLSRLLRWRVGAGWYVVALLTAPLAFAGAAFA